MCIFSSLNIELENVSLYLPFKRASKIQHLYLITHLVQTFAMDHTTVLLSLQKRPYDPNKLSAPNSHASLAAEILTFT